MNMPHVRHQIAELSASFAVRVPAPDWRALHAHEGRRLRVRLADGRTVSGIAAGLAPSGALRLRTRVGTRDISSGRVLANAPRARAAKASLKPIS